jgi:hypothetical protein
MIPKTNFPLIFLAIFLTLPILSGCGPNQGAPTVPPTATPEMEASPMKTTPETSDATAPKADVLSVTVSGEPGAYRFAVEIRSPDLGCQQYADWWEVVSEDGELLYRRILMHSHVNEQPFTRSGGPAPVDVDDVVWVRAHMNPGGYGGMAFKGSVSAGFQQAEPDPDFAADLEETPPLPDDCAF